MKTLSFFYLIGYCLFLNTWAAEITTPNFNDAFNSAQSFLPATKMIIGIQCFCEGQVAPDHKITYPAPARFTYNLEDVSFYKRPMVKEALNLCAAMVMRNHVTSHNSIYHEYSLGNHYIFYCIQMHSSITMCLAHKSYPKGLCYDLLQRVHKDYSQDNLQSLLKDYNGGRLEADKITKVQTEISDVKQVLLDNVEALTARQEKLSDLKDRTDALSVQSQIFLGQAKKLNSCCIIL